MKTTHQKHSNKNRTAGHLSRISLACIVLLLNGCGQRGALYIPTAPEAAQRSTIGDVLTNKPATSAPATTTPAPAPVPANTN
jgi:predicted small lipoprotein YifL